MVTHMVTIGPVMEKVRHETMVRIMVMGEAREGKGGNMIMVKRGKSDPGVVRVVGTGTTSRRAAWSTVNDAVRGPRGVGPMMLVTRITRKEDEDIGNTRERTLLRERTRLKKEEPKKNGAADRDVYVLPHREIHTHATPGRVLRVERN